MTLAVIATITSKYCHIWTPEDLLSHTPALLLEVDEKVTEKILSLVIPICQNVSLLCAIEIISM